MDISIYPSKGYLNTKFGFKLYGTKKIKPFKFHFSDGSSTELLKGNTTIYKQFSSAGEYTVTAECDGIKIEKKIFVADSYKFGNGKTLDIYFPEKNGVVVQRKTTGINIFYKEIGTTISKDIVPDEIFNWDESHSLFISTFQSKKSTPLAKIGVFNYDKAEFVSEYEGHYVKYWQESTTLLFYKGSTISILSRQDGLFEFEGNFKAFNSANHVFENCHIIYEKEDKLWQFNLRFHKHELIGLHKFHELTPADNLICVFNEDIYHIWDLYCGKFVAKNVNSYTVFENRDILIHDSNEGELSLKIINADNGDESLRFEYYTNSISADGKFIIRYSSNNYLQVYNRDSLDSSLSFIPFKYIKSLISDLIIVESEGKEAIYSLVTNKILYSGEENISFAFSYGERSILVFENYTDVLFYEYTNTLRKIVSFEGSFEQTMITRLIDRGHLWIRTGTTNTFRIYNGLNKILLKEVHLKGSFGDWILTDAPSLLNIFSLDERSVYYEKLYQINNGANEGIVKKGDGYYLVSLAEQRTKEEKIFSPDYVYSDCEIHPSGISVILCKDGDSVFQAGLTELIDLNTMDKIEVPDTSFVRIDHKGNIVLRSGMRRNSTPRIFDPYSFQEIEYPEFNLYKFYSPDGRFKSNIGIETKQVQEIVPNQYVLEDGIRKPKTSNKNEKYVTIIDEYLNKEYKIKVYENTKWFNFLSFSFDNRFFGLAGCNSGGILELFQLDGKSEIERLILLRQLNANWRCVFSQNGKYIACYDSNPITYLYKLDSIEGADIEKSVCKIQNRSIECFSPDSKFMVLSQHKYLAITMGGIGWIPSSRLYINDIESKAEILELKEHNTQVKFANFSSDCTKLISRSEDGIVIIRNFDYSSLLKKRKSVGVSITNETVG